jgi:hypothetical protein
MREARILEMPGVLLSDFCSVFARCWCSRDCVSLFLEDERVVMRRCNDWVCGRRKRNSSMRRQQVEKPRPLHLRQCQLSVFRSGDTMSLVADLPVCACNQYSVD